jgi:hypothetical protein
MENEKKFYSKTAIVLFSLIGSTILGTLLYSANLKIIGKNKYVPVLLILSLIYTIGGMYLFKSLGVPTYYIFVPLHLIGSLAIIFPLWNKQIGRGRNYEKRKSATTIAIVLAIIGLLVLVNILL